jgi:hypothetical protein
LLCTFSPSSFLIIEKRKEKEKENSFHPYINLSASSYKQFNALTLTKHLSPKAENINNG